MYQNIKVVQQRPSAGCRDMDQSYAALASFSNTAGRINPKSTSHNLITEALKFD